MIHYIGPIAVRQPHYGSFQNEGDVVLSHKHYFSHPMFVTHGAYEINLLKVSLLDAFGYPLNATVEESRIVRADDEINWFLVLKGRWHASRALVNRSRYQCIYPHRFECAHSIGNVGQQAEKPFIKTDDDGTRWLRIDESISEEPTGFQEAYA